MSPARRSTAPLLSLGFEKQRRVRRMAPSFRLRAVRMSPRVPTISSVEPPPMSHTRALAVEDRHGLEHAEVDQARLLEARDDLDVDALGPGPLDEGARFSASRTAEVATARTVAPWMAATCRKRSRASMPRLMAAG